MIKVTIENNYCLIEPRGPLTREDFTTIAEQVDPIIESNGELDGLIIKTRDFPGWKSFSDLIEHFRFIKQHHQNIKKVALVTDAKIADLVPSIVNHFLKAEVKHFNFNDYKDAINWIARE